MRSLFSVLLVSLVASTGFADEVHIVQSGKDYRSYSYKELQRRVWDLEMAVYQLQRRVFELESGQGDSNGRPNEPNWICTVDAPFGQFYSATGNTMAVAKSKVIEKCKADNAFDSHCAKVRCEH